MAWSDLLTALGLLLVIEGVLPFMSPARFRQALLNYAAVENRWMRGLGLASMVVGLLILNAVK
ncbi:DUF2065 family protein [Panacagrimonas sp.]|uniref:DUF2065 family protein n=1 Tax=Panacagrimonas sp. TaxID=2480088 RepID=UPI003B5227D2